MGFFMTQTDDMAHFTRMALNDSALAEEGLLASEPAILSSMNTCMDQTQLAMIVYMDDWIAEICQDYDSQIEEICTSLALIQSEVNKVK